MHLYESAFRIEGVTLFNSFYRAVMIYSVIIENKAVAVLLRMVAVMDARHFQYQQGIAPKYL